MVETDCPYLAPVPYRGKRCEPAYTRLVAERVASLRGEQPRGNRRADHGERGRLLPVHPEGRLHRSWNPTAPEITSPFVFHDPKGRRWPRLRRVLVLLGVMVFLGVVLFVQALFVSPRLRLPASVRKLKGQLKAIEMQEAQQQSAKLERHRPGVAEILPEDRSRSGTDRETAGIGPSASRQSSPRSGSDSTRTGMRIPTARWKNTPMNSPMSARSGWR